MSCEFSSYYHNGDLLRVTAKGRDVGLDPLHSKILIEEPKILFKRKELLGTWKTKDIGPIIESNNHNILILCEARLYERQSEYGVTTR